MHFSVLRIAVLCALCAGAASASGLFSSGGLAELTRAAVAQNPGLAARRFLLESASEDDNVARAPLLPQIGVGASKTLEDDSGDEPREAVLSLTQQIFNLPLWDIYQSSKRRTAAAAARHAGARQSLRLSVVAAWLDLRLADDLTRLTEARIELAEEQLSRAQSFAEAGAGTVVDVLDARAQTAGLRADLLQNRHDRRLAQDRLYALSGMRGVAARLDEAALRRRPPLPPLGEWLARVAKDSHQAAAARAELEAAELLVRAAARAVYPRLELSVQTRTEGGLSGHRENIALSAEQSLFTGGRVGAESRRTLSDRAAARQNMREVLRQEELRARELHGRAALALARRDALAAAETAAAAALEATAAGVEGGARIVADVLDAEETLFDARLELRRARYNYLREVAALHVLAGAADEQFIESLDALFRPDGKENDDV
ncbi:MAG: TolC family protein [Gammaproteobacteria bacterium]